MYTRMHRKAQISTIIKFRQSFARLRKCSKVFVFKDLIKVQNGNRMECGVYLSFVSSTSTRDKKTERKKAPTFYNWIGNMLAYYQSTSRGMCQAFGP